MFVQLFLSTVNEIKGINILDQLILFIQFFFNTEIKEKSFDALILTTKNVLKKQQMFLALC